MAPSILRGIPRHLFIPILMAAAQLGLALTVAGWLGILPAWDEVIFSTFDSHGYRSLADWIWGRGDGANTRVFLLRPFVYPLFLGLRVLVGDHGIVMLQLVLNACTTALVFLSARSATRSSFVAVVMTSLLITNLTFGLIAFHALTETLAIFFLAVHLFFLARLLSGVRGSIWWKFGTGFSISLAACTKPALAPYLLFLVVCFFWSTWMGSRRDGESVGDHRNTRRRLMARIGFLLILASPVVVQLALTRSLTGDATFSIAGRLALEGRVFPAVYGVAELGTFIVRGEEPATRAEAAYPNLDDKLGYLADHPVATLKVLKTTIWDMNWRSSSSFTEHPASVIRHPRSARRLTRISASMNRFFHGFTSRSFRSGSSRSWPCGPTKPIGAC